MLCDELCTNGTRHKVGDVEFEFVRGLAPRDPRIERFMITGTTGCFDFCKLFESTCKSDVWRYPHGLRVSLPLAHVFTSRDSVLQTREP